MLDQLLAVSGADAELAHKGRVLNGMLLSIIALVLLYIVLSAIFTGTMVVHPTAAAMAGAAFLLYLIARRGYITVSAVALIGVIIVILTIGTLQPTARGLSVLLTPTLLALPVVLTGVLTSWRWVPPVTLLTCLDIIWLYNAGAPSLNDYRIEHRTDMVIFTLEAILLMLGSGVLGVLSSRQVAQALTTLRRQNQELLTANADLARQRRQADALGAGIATLAAQLSEVSTRQIHGVSAQAQSITQVVSAVAQLHQAADQIAAMGQQVRQAAEATIVNVQRGQEILLRSREAVQHNRAQVQFVIERLAALETVTARITSFVDSIRELSEETHLLALNATIEAAGAGMLGRRFGVVATEVRHLSTRANEVVGQIHPLIEELEQAGRATVAATQQTIAVAAAVEGSSAEVRDTQEQVVQAVQRTTELVQMISTATHQQTSATEQVTHTMHEIAAISTATRQDAGALNEVIHELLTAAELLNSTVRVAPAPS